jgi:putative peptidoglycan lipid II flippase
LASRIAAIRDECAILGGLGQIAIQWPLLRREGWRYAAVLDGKDEGLREVMRLMAPATIGLAAVQINVFVNTVLATGEGTGAVSWLNYAFRLMYLPIGLFGVSIGTAALPEISRHTAVSDTDGLRRTVANALRLTIVLNVPATIGLMVLARPIVSLLLERGRFGPADTAATAAALMCYAPGLLGYAAVKIASPTFYALRDSRTPVIASAIAVALNIVLNLTLVRAMGFTGLALGATLAAIAHAAILLWLLHRHVGSVGGRENLRALALITIAALAMGAVAWGSQHGLEALLTGRSTIVRAARVFASISAGLVTLVTAAHFLHIDEFKEALRRVASRLGAS